LPLLFCWLNGDLGQIVKCSLLSSAMRCLSVWGRQHLLCPCRHRQACILHQHALHPCNPLLHFCHFTTVARLYCLIRLQLQCFRRTWRVLCLPCALMHHMLAGAALGISACRWSPTCTVVADMQHGPMPSLAVQQGCALCRDLSKNGLTGTLPASWGALASLATLCAPYPCLWRFDGRCWTSAQVKQCSACLAYCFAL
jgi:hypothetical protein